MDKAIHKPTIKTVVGQFEFSIQDTKMFACLRQESYIKELQFLSSLLKSDDVIIDVGANIGVFSVVFAKKSKNVHAFEPHPETYERLIKNINLNQVKVFTYNCAVGSCEGTASLNEHSVASETTLSTGNEIKITSLDAHFDYVDFIKIDVEGMEPSVLKGAKKLLQTRPTLYFEVQRNQLRQYGFDLDSFNIPKYPFLYTYVFGKWYKIPSILIGVLIINPGCLFGRSMVINILATKKKIKAESLLKLFFRKILRKLR